MAYKPKQGDWVRVEYLVNGKHYVIEGSYEQTTDPENGHVVLVRATPRGAKRTQIHVSRVVSIRKVK